MEAEDVIADGAKHAAVYVRDLWQRRRADAEGILEPQLAELAPRLDLLVAAALGTSLPLRVAQPPAPPTLLRRLFRAAELRRQPPEALPGTDGEAIYLPRRLDLADGAERATRYRVMALQQAARCLSGAAAAYPHGGPVALQDLYLLIFAAHADSVLARTLPGIVPQLAGARAETLALRAELPSAPRARTLEQWYREWLAAAPHVVPARLEGCRSAEEVLARAACLLEELPPGVDCGLRRDRVLGAILRRREQESGRHAGVDSHPAANEAQPPPRSARLRRRPSVRDPQPGEDDKRTGLWMVQTAAPQDHVEDPRGMQRPTDRDEHQAAEEFADSLSDLDEARLVWSPGTPREVLLGDDPPEARARRAHAPASTPGDRLSYAEWDYRAEAYRVPGATVRIERCAERGGEWAQLLLARRRTTLTAIRREFELLRVRPVLQRRRFDGDEIDLDAFIESRSDFLAGLHLDQRLYVSRRPARKPMAIALLIDISGSTDGWVSSNLRIVDVEKEAMLLVCQALEVLGDPYTVQAFSGESAGDVTVWPVKDFGEAYGETVARRMAWLDPQRYTRVGAALRHASALLMRRTAEHRLLLLLSDGKPNDVDDYQGRYGVEDARQAIVEARAQGIHPFCLTVDRHAAAYLPHIFGTGQYGLLPRTELLPLVLLDWLKRLILRAD